MNSKTKYFQVKLIVFYPSPVKAIGARLAIRGKPIFQPQWPSTSSPPDVAFERARGDSDSARDTPL